MLNSLSTIQNFTNKQSTSNLFQNPNFAIPALANGTWAYYTGITIPNWQILITLGGAPFVNNLAAAGLSFSSPTPNGYQFLAVQRLTAFLQTFTFSNTLYYSMSFYAAGRQTGANSVLIGIYDSTSTLITTLFSNIAPAYASGWVKYSTSFTVATSGTYSIKLSGTLSTDSMTGFTGFVLNQKTNLVTNGNFSSPVVPANAPLFVSSASLVTGWTIFGGSIINISTSWGFISPYPYGSQALILQGVSTTQPYISFKAYLQSNIVYTLSFWGCARPIDSNLGLGFNPILIQLYNSGIMYQIIGTYTPNSYTAWSNYTVTFSPPMTLNFNVRFTPTNTNLSTTALQNFVLTS